MIYKHKITNQESEAFRLLIGGMACTGVLRPELDHTIGEICVGLYKIKSDSIRKKFAGSNQRDCHKPYLAGRDDLIAFDNTVQTMVKYDVGYHYKMDGTRTLIIEPQLGYSVVTLYPLIATLMHAANDIDVSDDNFRAWLINNRPKVNRMETLETLPRGNAWQIGKRPKVKMNMSEDTKNDELFKFLQLREHAGDVKITQEMGQQLFNLLVECAEAIGHEEVSGDALATDSDKFVLELVNNLINSAKPKPAASFDRMALNDFIRLNAAFMKENGLPILSGTNYAVDGSVSAAIKVFGVPDISVRGDEKWYLKMHGMVCRVYSDEGYLELNVERDTKNSTRRLIISELVGMIKEAMNEESSKEKD